MKQSDIPSKFSVPFANSAGGGFIRTIPLTPSGTPGQASIQTGFPPENFLPLSGGGVPPFGQDFNGLMNQISAWSRYQGAGGVVPYDSAFQTAVGGYPKSSIIESVAAPGTFFISTVDDNITNPDTGGAGWSPWPSATALLAAGTISNVQQFTTSTRVVEAGNAGNGYTVTPWTPGAYVKKSATSKLIVWASFPTFTPTGPTGRGSGQGSLAVGGNSLVFIPSNNTSSESRGEGTLVQVMSGVTAGSKALSVSFSRNDSQTWDGVFCFNSADDASYPAATQATIVLAEIGI